MHYLFFCTANIFNFRKRIHMDTYFTISGKSEGMYKEKGSRFISLAFPVTAEEQVKPIISDLKKEYYDARHHCYAWRLGADGGRTRTMDDGEPSSTAGKPILGQIVSNNLTNILIVVIRYFGGTKLGVSGLIRAYRDAAADAIANADIVERTVDAFYKLTFGYAEMNGVMKVIKDMSPNVHSQNFDNLCEMTVSVRRDDEEAVIGRFRDVEGVTAEFIEYR